MRRLSFSAALFLAALLTFSVSHALAAPRAASPQLVAALATLRTHGLASAQSVLPTLDAADAAALRAWLSGNSRDDLHAAGATDAEIGPPVYPIDYHIVWLGAAPEPAPTPTPAPTPAPKKKGGFFGALLSAAVPALKVPLGSSSSSSSSSTTTYNTNGWDKQTTTTTSSSSTSASMSINAGALLGMLVDSAANRPAPPPQTHPSRSELLHWHKLELGRFATAPATPSGIGVERGLAGVRNNYGEGGACVTFANDTGKTVSEVDFDFTYIDRAGYYLQTMALNRKGPFAPGAQIRGPEDRQQMSREAMNCTFLGSSEPGVPRIPSLVRASGVAYAVRRVVFADGTAWSAY